MQISALFQILSNWIKRLPRFSILQIVTALVAMGILHVLVTLTTPYIIGSTAYAKLEPVLPLNEMKVLPAVNPSQQVIPYLGPDARYAMCRYDTRKGPVIVHANLPSLAWTLTVHSLTGENIYVAEGAEDQETQIALQLLPSENRFMGLTPESLGFASSKDSIQSLETTRGIVVVRAPDKGPTYERQILLKLLESECTPSVASKKK